MPIGVLLWVLSSYYVMFVNMGVYGVYHYSSDYAE